MEPKIKDRGHLHKSEELGKNQGAWCLKFPGSDRTVMLRTERYRYDLEKKRPSQIQAYMQVRCLQKNCTKGSKKKQLMSPLLITAIH